MGNAEDNYLYHTIQPKETLYSLSIRYKVPGPDIIAANPGLSVSTFTIGKTIRILATPIETLPTKEVKTVTKEIEYTIAKKETMYRICRKFNVSSAELIKRNPELKNGVKAGMVIKIPVETKETVTETAPAMHEKRRQCPFVDPPRDQARQYDQGSFVIAVHDKRSNSICKHVAFY